MKEITERHNRDVEARFKSAKAGRGRSLTPARSLEERERASMVVRRQTRICAKPALAYDAEPVSHIVVDERCVARPGVHAEAVPSEERALLSSPTEDDLDQAAARIVCGARDAVKVEMIASLVRTPNGMIRVDEREHTDDRIVTENTI